MTWQALAQIGAVVLLTPILVVLGALVSAYDFWKSRGYHMDVLCKAQSVCTILIRLWRYRHIPGPPPNLLMGNMPDIIKQGGSHVAFQDYAKKYGPIFKVFFLKSMFITVADPDLAHQLMYKLINRPPIFNPAVRLMPKYQTELDEQGLVFVSNGVWRMLRNAWQPAFAPGSLRHYQQLMSSSAQQLVDAVARLAKTAHHTADVDAAQLSSNGHATNAEEEQYVDLHTLFNKMTLDVVGACAYGVKFNAVGGTSQKTATETGMAGIGPTLQQACKDFFSVLSVTTGSKYAMLAAVMPSLQPIISWLAQVFPDPPYTKLLSSRILIRGAGDTLIKDWQDRFQHTAEAPASDAASKPEAGVKKTGGLHGVEPGSFLGLLLEAQRKAALNKSPDQLDNVTLSAQAHTFIMAGTETTGNTLSFAVYFLCQNPDKLDRLLQEVDAHGRDKPSGPDDEFPYAEAVINETLRLLPAAPATSRLVDTPHDLQVGGYRVPTGTSLLFPVYNMHRDPDVWPRAEEFLPERWLPEGRKEWGPRKPDAYMPFGAGPRMCIGWKFALQEARIALVQVYKNFTFKLQPGQVGGIWGVASLHTKTATQRAGIRPGYTAPH